MDYLQDIYCANLNAVYNMGGYLDLPADGKWVCERHKFEQCKFYFITSGACYVEINRKNYRFSAGDWLFIPPNVEHAYQNDNSAPFRKYWAHFDVYSCAEFFSAVELPFVVKVKTNGKIASLFRKLLNSAKSNDLSDKLTVKSCLISLLAEFIKTAKPNGVSVVKTADARLDDLLRFINENLDGVLNKIQTPTLLIFGKEDKETPLYMAKRYHKGLINSQLVVIKNAGHFAFIDKPHKFNREVEEFLLRN